MADLDKEQRSGFSFLAFSLGIAGALPVLVWLCTYPISTPAEPDAQCRAQAAAHGAGEYYLDTKTGRIEWRWKTPETSSLYFRTN